MAMPLQTYALVVSAGPTARPLQRIDLGQVELDGFFLTTDAEGAPQLTPRSVFTAGDPLNFHFEISVPENADYGTFFGSVNVTGWIVDQGGETLWIQGLGTHEIPGGISIPVTSEGLEVPAGMATGRYTAHLKVTLGNGAETYAPPWPFDIVPP